MPKRPTIIDVARLAGVSKATVARVVNGQDDIVSEKTRLRVMAAIEKLGYERNAVAGSLRTDKTNMIALCIPDITNPFWSEVVRGVQDTLEACEYAVMTVNSDWDGQREMNYLKLVRRNRFDGLIINPTNVSGTDFGEMEIPIVMLGTGDGYPDYDSVGSDTGQATLEALDYLYELSHRRIALIAGRSMRRKSTTRYHSYLAFLARHGLRLDPELIIHCEFSMQEGAEAAQKLLSLDNPPTALFAANDIIAIGALQTANRLNWRVPEDLSIIGMDDIYAAVMTSPPLTTIKKQKYETGAHAARMLLERLSGDTSPPRNILLPCSLIKRGSVAVPT